MQARVLALCGGVGGAKLALGLARELAADHLVIVTNTGDDFEHLGLRVCPDLDTVMYTLAGLANPDSGWGRRDETWHFMEALGAYGAETWFQLGDRDLATHVERTRCLRQGESLTRVTRRLSLALGVEHRIAPMSDDLVSTTVSTDAGDMPFQHYFVRERCAPRVNGVSYVGAEAAAPPAYVRELLYDTALACVVICPSNPYLSIGPILALPGMHEGLRDCPAPVVAVSPVIGGRAVKGPTAKIMGELGEEPSAAGVAAHYGNLIDGFVIDEADQGQRETIEAAGVHVAVTATMMRTLADRERLAAQVLAFAEGLRGASAGTGEARP